MSYLYVDSNGQQKGPLPLNVLENLLRKGAAGITSLTLCWTNGMDTWKPLIEVIIYLFFYLLSFFFY